MKKAIASVCVLATCAILCGTIALAAPPSGVGRRPVLQVDYPFPTADKPQSKTWFSHGSWWAILPRLNGPSLWERRETGWTEHAEVQTTLAGVPGRADVWWDGQQATAVAAADRIIRIFRLTPSDRAGKTWQARVLATCFSPASDAIETVTIARDGGGGWWMAAVVQEKVFAWHSSDAATWSKAQIIGTGVDADDICAITPMAGGVAVIWSDQRHDAVNFRARRDGDAAGDWRPVEVVQSGGSNADDHLHAVLAADGSLWVASKNSVDGVGRPQFVLRTRSPAGEWRNLPYGILPADASMSRPAIVLGPGGLILAGHSLYRRKTSSEIIFGRIDVSRPEILTDPQVVIAPAPDLHTRVVDISVPKAAYPEEGPWLVLTSDGEGRVFECDLRAFWSRP